VSRLKAKKGSETMTKICRKKKFTTKIQKWVLLTLFLSTAPKPSIRKLFDYSTNAEQKNSSNFYNFLSPAM
jgi:TRAP-type mannitol/chloroaromatic compound transport system permease small subunit